MGADGALVAGADGALVAGTDGALAGGGALVGDAEEAPAVGACGLGTEEDACDGGEEEGRSETKSARDEALDEYRKTLENTFSEGKHVNEITTDVRVWTEDR